MAFHTEKDLKSKNARRKKVYILAKDAWGLSRSAKGPAFKALNMQKKKTICRKMQTYNKNMSEESEVRQIIVCRPKRPQPVVSTTNHRGKPVKK